MRGDGDGGFGGVGWGRGERTKTNSASASPQLIFSSDRVYTVEAVLRQQFDVCFVAAATMISAAREAWGAFRALMSFHRPHTEQHTVLNFSSIRIVNPQTAMFGGTEISRYLSTPLFPLMVVMAYWSVPPVVRRDE